MCLGATFIKRRTIAAHAAAGRVRARQLGLGTAPLGHGQRLDQERGALQGTVVTVASSVVDWWWATVPLTITYRTQAHQYSGAELYGLTYGGRDINKSLQRYAGFAFCDFTIVVMSKNSTNFKFLAASHAGICSAYVALSMRSWSTRRYGILTDRQLTHEPIQAEKIDIVAHSMGVTLARKAIKGGTVRAPWCGCVQQFTNSRLVKIGRRFRCTWPASRATWAAPSRTRSTHWSPSRAPTTACACAWWPASARRRRAAR